MASIHKDSRGKSPFWYCAYYGPDGRRMLRSTKETDRKVAFKLCQLWEEAGVKARRKELSAAQGRKIISEMVAISTGETMSFHTARGWLNDWLANKVGTVTQRSLFRLQQVLGDFVSHLGPRAEASIASVSPGDVIAFRNKLREEGRSVATCNAIRSMLSVPFDVAHKLAFIPVNPVSAVEPLKDRSAKLGREPFTAEEVARLVKCAEGDWCGAVLLGATTGLRLGDLANLCWERIDLDAGLLRIATQKTGKLVVLPMHPDFTNWLSGRPRGIGRAVVFPELAGKRIAGRRGLSAQFRRIVEAAGITRQVTPREGKGRTLTNKSFHCLRHSFVSRLANAGVASEVRQRLAGHASAESHKLYTHVEIEQLRRAVAKLPRLQAE